MAAEQGCQDRTARIRQPGQDRKEWRARKGQADQDSQYRTAKRDRQNRTGRTGQANRTG
jgi:hypothetical protein